MNSLQIESWALRVIDCVNACQPNEDTRVELKREWIDPQKAARQIAGQANASRGEPILWLIGVDQKNGVLGAEDTELANWYPAVKAQFDEGIAPLLINLNIPVGEETVVALLFETDRAPFVVKNSDGGPIQREVPWREGNSTRSAHRSDLIRLLAPLELLPDIEILDAGINLITEGFDSAGNQISDETKLVLALYIVPRSGAQVVIPFHRCKAWYEVLGEFDGCNVRVPFHTIRLTPDNYRLNSSRVFVDNADPRYGVIVDTNSELIVNGPGRIALAASKWEIPPLPEGLVINFQVTVHLFSAHTDSPVVLSKKVPYSQVKS